MEMQITDVDANLKKVTFNGRLDTPAVLGVETQFVTGLVPAGKSAIVDLSKVEFMGSMAIRMFIHVSRILREKKVKLALYAPQSMVNEVLEIARVKEIVPICADASEAAAAVRGANPTPA
jgi:anti-anti-sigma factor